MNQTSCECVAGVQNNKFKEAMGNEKKTKPFRLNNIWPDIIQFSLSGWYCSCSVSVLISRYYLFLHTASRAVFPNYERHSVIEARAVLRPVSRPIPFKVTHKIYFNCLARTKSDLDEL